MSDGGGFRFLVNPVNKNAIIQGGKNNTDFGFATRTNQTTYERIRIKNNGNFGVGILDPQRTIHIKDVMRLEPISEAPSDPDEGDIYMNGVTHKLMVYDGMNWQACW